MNASRPPVPVATLLAEREWVRALARSLVRDESTADDAAQETLVAALRNPPGDEATIRPWLSVVLRNVLHARFRAESRRARREEVSARPEASAAADEVVIRAETHRRVVEAVMDLAEPYRTTVLLRYFDGLGPGEIASRTGVPPETVRTRTRRAIAQLRDRLAPPSEPNRCAALTALAGPWADGVAESAPAFESGSPVGAPIPARTVWVARAVAAAVAVVLMVAAWIVMLRDGGPPGAPGGGTGSGLAAGAAFARGGPGVPAAPPAPPRATPTAADPDVPGEPPGEPGAPPSAVDAAAAGTPAPAVTTSGDLRLRVAIDPATPRVGDAVHVVATFENAGPGRVRFFVPEWARDPFTPTWRLTDADGIEWAPVPASAQSMWTIGLQGAIVDLGPGESWSGRSVASEFAPSEAVAGTGGGHVDGAPLRPGRYLLAATYSRASTDLPHGRAGFRVEMLPAEGVWTGTVRAPEVALAIAEPDRPSLTIQGPKEPVSGAIVPGELVPGRPWVVTAEVANPGPESIEFPAGIVLRASTKADGVIATVTASLHDALAAPVDRTTVDRIRLAPGERRRVDLDLARALPVPLRWPSYVLLVASLESRDRTVALSSNMLFRRVAAPPDAAKRGLRLSAEARTGAGGEPVVDVTLRNAGETVLLVPRDLGWPSSLRFVARRPPAASQPPDASQPADANRPPDENRPPDANRAAAPIEVAVEHGTLIAPTVAWVVATGRRDGPSARGDFVELRPGDVLSTSHDLSAAPHRRLPPGLYLVSVTWSNLDDGRTAGLEQTDVVVGELTAADVAVSIVDGPDGPPPR